MQLIYRIYYFLITRLRSQRWLAEILFKVKIPAEVEGPYWDYTTLLLKTELPGFLRNDMKILEIGIGRAAVLLASLNKKIFGDCTGVDLQPEFVSSARKVLQCNAMENVEVFQSDLFENVTGLYDLIFFNSIYIKTEWGRKYLADYVDSTWDGGGKWNGDHIKICEVSIGISEARRRGFVGG